MLSETMRAAPSRRPAVKIAGGYVTLKTDWHRKRGDDYPVALDRIDTPEKLVVWLHHLAEKLWFDGLTCRELVEKVSDHFGWSLPWHC